MTDDGTILRLAADGYDARDISLFTHTPVLDVRAACKAAGVKLNKVTGRRPFVTVVKASPPEPKPRPARQPEPPPPKARRNPVEFAGRWLGRRLSERPSGFWLDGVPASLGSIMRAANAAARRAGAELCLHSDRWAP